ncbi:hypothetical protein C8C83_4780 [Flavobacterium sp. 90]|uniref:hypothetical protein n=1 Tax=unclassified Flavobacterium TaxID=196869 RepID=UPI000EB50B5A|nr:MULTISPECIES: hypothetical protein [unclassified Flavobacterium]RKR05432.1 hypothetical protein C8C82_5122 [Flavobacterium sp. 81]TCK56747.1 hypothetical protein C8C83_4780 [Flavobacterium sp. 90]
MIPVETRMNDDEMKILKNKIRQVSILIAFLSVFIIGFTITCYYFSGSFFIVFAGLIILSVLIYYYSTQIFGARKDLKEGIKIINEFKIIDKEEGFRRKNPSTFKIIFDSNVIRSCNVSEKVFLKLKLNDVIDIEYTKYGNWLLSVQFKGTDIESKYHIA